MQLIPGVHDAAIEAVKKNALTTPVRFTKVGPQEYQVDFGDTEYRLCKAERVRKNDRGAWFLYAKVPGREFNNFGGLTSPVKPGEGPGFWEEGFGRTLKQAKTNVKAWLQRGVTFSDNEWEI